MINTADETGENADKEDRFLIKTESHMQAAKRQNMTAPIELEEETSTKSVGNAEAETEPGKDTEEVTTVTATPELGETRETSAQRERPRRERRKPNYLKDYVTT